MIKKILCLAICIFTQFAYAEEKTVPLNREAVVFHNGKWYLCDPKVSSSAIMITIDGKTQCVNKSDLLGNRDQKSIRITTPQGYVDGLIGADNGVSKGVILVGNKMVLKYQTKIH
jgi:hypothetical protein